jgi:hypothetical protein
MSGKLQVIGARLDVVGRRRLILANLLQNFQWTALRCSRFFSSPCFRVASFCLSCLLAALTGFNSPRWLAIRQQSFYIRSVETEARRDIYSVALTFASCCLDLYFGILDF